ncbi:hypothetical protein SAMD00019534_012120 [Acytostelium subglobosum LB1]|uniref:hypothetical protein n=1 Tax=Acytostelium subglobosum LB1 TaxID=1410327 RepID=UPI000644BAD6|nr:hypothetical protein SAMD00019534_012120 [Acytostelium subglobosum LB1]GAM18037.1 hypothetical protein SAMD00019534_012120 [Acytostelium subglobosum LB1]|eukprot:XP_012758633.1 hypothetical protein SAMD00019534_012120 [Acytostelium subglobosum LB1]
MADNICKLVLTFYKLSNELGDTGHVRNVLFENPTIFNQASMSAASLNQSMSCAKLRHHSSPSSTKRVAPIRMSSEKEDLITVSVFHEEQAGNEEEIEKFILNIMLEFHNKFGALIQGLKPTLNEMNEYPDVCKTKAVDIVNSFKEFEQVVDDIKGHTSLH